MYLASPTATSTEHKTVNSYKFPNMIICPSTWANGSKLKQLPISMDALYFASSLLYHNVDERDLNKSVKEAALEFYSYANRTSKSMLEFYYDFVFDVKHVLTFDKYPMFNIPGQPNKPTYSLQLVMVNFVTN